MKRYIKFSQEIYNLKGEPAWLVTYGYDCGDGESGPIVQQDTWIVYAKSADAACRKFENEFDIEGYCGCGARKATQKEIDEWYSYMNEPEDLPFSSTKTKKRSIKASEFVVTVGDVEEYYIEADNEDDALQEFLDIYAEAEDLEEYEEDPSYIWVRESEDDIDASKKICASEWPEELTYDNYPEGDQIIEGLIQAVDYLDIFEEPSTQGGVGSDFFFTNDGEELGSIDIQEEEKILSDLYHSSKSKEDYYKKVKIWLANFLNL